MKFSLKDFLIGASVTAVLIPLGVFAERTAIPVLTGLFASTTLSVALPAPSINISNATTTGSVSNGPMYFVVTALDGAGGESVSSNLMASTSPDNTHAWNVRWTAIPGATGYRVYFSTTTTALNFVQYFNATTTNAYNFTSTSSPIFTTVGAPVTGSGNAYVDKVNSSGNSWINGGNFAVGTTTSVSLFSVVNQPLGTGVVATTSSVFGDQATSTSRTCFNVVTSAGTKGSFYINAAGVLVAELKSCL